MENVRVLIRCIYYKAVEPSCDIVEMEPEVWNAFLNGTKSQRKSLACKLLNKENMYSYIREVAWVPLTGLKLENFTFEK